MEQQNVKKNNTANHSALTENIAFWQFICPSANGKGRFSRILAFCDLLQRKSLADKTGDGNYLAVTYQELADKWGWQRTTVKNYLQNLQLLGVLSVTRDFSSGKTVVSIF